MECKVGGHIYCGYLMNQSGEPWNGWDHIHWALSEDYDEDAVPILGGIEFLWTSVGHRDMLSTSISTPTAYLQAITPLSRHWIMMANLLMLSNQETTMVTTAD